MLTHFRYTVEPSYIEKTMAIKNDGEISGSKRAYLRDGVSFVRFLAWGYKISEWEARFRLTEFRRKKKNFVGIVHQNVSAPVLMLRFPIIVRRKDSQQGCSLFK
jgi:Xaa-Pro aminopeptidase